MAPAAFAAPALSLRASRSSLPTQTPRCSIVDEAYPESVRNAAPHISFNGESGIFFSMARVKAFTEETGEPPLFSYDDETTKDWSTSKAPAAGPICWPAGDGRDVTMTGSRGSFTVGNDREYKEAPPGGFFKRSMDQ